ncbi:TraR/DksA C4-type zinc finger protein [Pasteurella multocida]|uniref:TraR/DksA C4-type zinc finger protein n=1 Tax=Pasteurella multocida TaxID=747 RepID=UPI00292F0426|nr:TraR/DksA C4-type zinc finger protein [Pasteurella multocida]WNY75959.1 TraR/DksA C4-type zinc finger protein [Pasteurella multocida]
MDLADISQQRDEQAYQRFLKRHKSVAVETNNARFCVDCGELIPIKRVEAVPHCCRCIHCQEKAERR